MDRQVRPFGRTYARLVLSSIAAGVGIALLGYYPTLRIAGPSGMGAMAAGISISLVAACIGSIPIALAGRRESATAKMPQAILMATTLRFLLVLALAASVLLADWFDRAVLGFWVGLSYLVMLAVDTIFAVHVVGTLRGRSS